MKLQNKMTGILLAAAMFTMSGVPALAASDTYTKAVGLAVPVELQGFQNDDQNFLDIRMFLADDNGNLELLVCFSKSNGRMQGSANQYTQYSSQDGGKNWTKAPVTWLKSDYESGNTPFIMQPNGTIYGMLDAAEHYTELNDMGGTSGYPTYELNKIVGGIKQAVPNSQLIGKEFSSPRLLGITAQGDAVIDVERYGTMRDLASRKPMIMVLDGQTGKQKALWEIDKSHHFYADDKIITTQRIKADEQTPRSFTRYHLLTGQKLGTIPAPKGVDGARMAGADGSMYLIGDQGVYRLAPDENAFTKLSGDGVSVQSGWSCASPNGTVYAFTQYENSDNPDDSKKGTLTGFVRYSPT